eukprot:273921-Amphidinium_carterae.1
MSLEVTLDEDGQVINNYREQPQGQLSTARPALDLRRRLQPGDEAEPGGASNCKATTDPSGNDLSAVVDQDDRPGRQLGKTKQGKCRDSRRARGRVFQQYVPLEEFGSSMGNEES